MSDEALDSQFATELRAHFLGDQLQLVERVAAYIPHADTCVSGLRLTRHVAGETVEEAWRADGHWAALADAASRQLEEGSLSYIVDPYAAPMLLGLFDAGIEVDACLVEAALRPPDAVVAYSGLGFTRDHLPMLLKARDRREADPSELTTWMRGFVDGAIRPSAHELLGRLVDLHAQARTQGPPLQHLVRDLPSSFETTVDWGQLLPDDDQAQLGWSRLVQFIAALIALSVDVVVISVRTQQFDDDVYVQLCQEDDGALHLEAVSDAFLEPALSPDAVGVLHEMGWQDPPGDGLPNYIRFLEPDETAPGNVARLLVDTLRRVYSARPGDGYRFEPQTHVRSLLRGDFGPELAASPMLSESQRSRLYLGIRFPHDVGAAPS